MGLPVVDVENFAQTMAINLFGTQRNNEISTGLALSKTEDLSKRCLIFSIFGNNV